MFKNFINKNLYEIYTKIKGKINIVLFLILVALLIWIIISFLLGNQSEENNNEVQEQSSYRPQETVIEGQDIDEEEYQEQENIINTFVEYCNNKQTEEAYNMLSSDCKEALYPTQSDFEQNYYNNVFSTTRICNLQSWINTKNYTTYRVRLIDDIMSTGDYGNSSNFQDYITIVEKNGKKYLNINQYINKENFEDVVTETNELYIKVESIETYVEYEEYTFKIRNKSDKSILIDTLQDASDTMFITTNQGRKRSCDYSNLNLLNLRIQPNNTKEIKLRYNKAVSSNDADNTISFLSIVKDYDTYMQDINNYKDFVELVINL